MATPGAPAGDFEPLRDAELPGRCLTWPSVRRADSAGEQPAGELSVFLSLLLALGHDALQLGEARVEGAPRTAHRVRRLGGGRGRNLC